MDRAARNQRSEKSCPGSGGHRDWRKVPEDVQGPNRAEGYGQHRRRASRAIHFELQSAGRRAFRISRYQGDGIAARCERPNAAWILPGAAAGKLISRTTPQRDNVALSRNVATAQ